MGFVLDKLKRKIEQDLELRKMKMPEFSPFMFDENIFPTIKLEEIQSLKTKKNGKIKKLKKVV